MQPAAWSRSVVPAQCTVKFGPAVAKQTPRSPLPRSCVQIETRADHTLFGTSQLRNNSTGRVGKERGTVERHFSGLPCLLPNTVRGDERHAIGGGMTLHDTPP